MDSESSPTISFLNVYQQTFALSLLSNLLHARHGETQKSLQTRIENRLPLAIFPVGTDWKVVWGPVVWLNPDNTEGAPDNVWYVARRPNVKFPGGKTMDTYVVAIAGTATHSKFDWVTEDGDVGNVIDLKAWIQQGLDTKPVAATNVDDTANVYISMGTAVGLWVLLNTKVPEGGKAKGQGTLLGDFLATIPTKARVIFTGHSLGGALSPSLATAWWMDTKMARSVTVDNVLVYPSAGPSPWNLNFVNVFEGLFPPSSNQPTGYKNWNVNLVNTLDVVPLAWCTKTQLEPTQNVTRIPTFNNAQGVDLTCLQVAVDWVMIPLANGSKITYRPLKASSFTGHGKVPFPVPKDPWPSQGKPFLPEWMADASFHHTWEYMVEAAVGIWTGFPADREQEESPMTAYEEAVVWPILRKIARSPEHEEFVAALEVKKVEAEVGAA